MKKATLLILIFLLALPLLFSCGTEPAEITTGAEAGSTEPLREVYTIAADGATDYAMIRADKMTSSALQAAVELRKAINEKYSADIPINSDWSKDNKENNTVTTGEDVHEILVGNTNRAESRAIAEEYSDMASGYVIKAVNGKIVIWGSTDDSLTYALGYFTENLLGDGVFEIEKNYLYVWDLCGEGMPLDLLTSEYTLLYASEDSDKVLNAANLLATALGELSGKSISPSSDAHVSEGGKEILVGKTNRAVSSEVLTELGYMDYTVRTFKDKVVILGGSPLATLNAADAFAELVKTGELNTLEEGFVYNYDFDPLIADSLIHRIDSFVPVWAGEFTPAEWLTDYEEKLYAMTSPTGRMTADSHRGDVQNYPENSLEGVLSALLMGADVIEIDIRLTKDNVMVLMHDATLKRTTDWNAKAGKNGLPSSENIEDWTYEQLLELNLLFDGKPTEYKIPTMYEAALLFVGRAQIHFDCKIETIDKNTDVYLLAEATGSKECFIYYYGLETMQTWLSYNKEDTEFRNFVTKMRGYLLKTGHALRRRLYDLVVQYGDIPEGWHKQYADGRKMVFTNKIYDFCRYISENQEPIKLP